MRVFSCTRTKWHVSSKRWNDPPGWNYTNTSGFETVYFVYWPLLLSLSLSPRVICLLFSFWVIARAVVGRFRWNHLEFASFLIRHTLVWRRKLYNSSCVFFKYSDEMTCELEEMKWPPWMKLYKHKLVRNRLFCLLASLIKDRKSVV